MQDILAPLYVDLMSKVHNILTNSTHASIQQQVFFIPAISKSNLMKIFYLTLGYLISFAGEFELSMGYSADGGVFSTFR